MAIRKLTVEAKPLTPTTLSEFEAAVAVPGERPLNPTRLRNLRGLIEDGLFHGVEWSLAIDRQDGDKVYRVDGQHTSKLLRQIYDQDQAMGVSGDAAEFPQGLLATLTTYEIDSLDEDGQDLFEMFNNPISTRTNTDALSVQRARHEELKGIDLQFLYKILTGVAHAGKKLTSDTIEELLGEEDIPIRRHVGELLALPEVRAFCLWTRQFATSENQAFLGKPAIVAAMLEQYLENQETATQWWEWVMNESHPDADHESRDLAEALRKLAGMGQKKPSPDDYHTKCARSWRKLQKAAGMAPPTEEETPVEPVTEVEPA